MGNTRGLTDKPITREIIEEDGRVVAAHLSDVVTDPNSAEAVQIPDPDQYPSANATKQNPLAVQQASSPADALDADDTRASTSSRSWTSTGTVSGGTYDVVLAPGTAYETALTDVPFDATPTAVNTLIAAQDSAKDGEGNVVVTASGAAVSAGNLDFTFQNGLAGENVPTLTVDGSGITGGGTLAAVTVTPGQHADAP
jgi:hypothetical protein